MEWYFYALIAAIFVTFQNTIKKHSLNKNNIFQYMFLEWFVLLILCLFIPIFIDITDISLTMLVIIGFRSLFLVAAIYFMNKAIQEMDLSEVTPLMNLQPLTILLVATIFLSEIIKLWQLFGIILLVLGTYLLEKGPNKDFLYPLRRLIKSQYIHHVIFAILAYTVSGVIAKVTLDSIHFSTLLFYSVIYEFLMITFVYFMFDKGINGFRKISKFDLFNSSLIGISGFLIGSFYFYSLSLAPVSLVIPVYRMSSLFTIFVGGKLFHEHNMIIKSLACLFMIIGTFMVLA